MRRRRFPFVRPKIPPKQGQKFQISHLQPLVQKLFNRFSHLTGISMNSLLPWRLEKYQDLHPKLKKEIQIDSNIPVYFHTVHSVYVPPISKRIQPVDFLANTFLLFFVGPKTSTIQHETIHALINLIGIPMENDHEDFTNVGANRIGSLIHSSYIKDPTQIMHNINEFYRKYGEDGLLALFAEIPELKSLRHIQQHEQMLVRQGMLDEHGFTEKGIAWFKEKVPAKGIHAKIKDMRIQRSLLDLHL